MSIVAKRSPISATAEYLYTVMGDEEVFPDRMNLMDPPMSYEGDQRN